MATKWFGKGFYIEDTLTPGLNTFFSVIDPMAREKGLISAALQLLNNVVNGSLKSFVKPPIKTGRLRGSGSIFVGTKKVGDSLFSSPKDGTPAETQGIDKDPNTIIIGFNTPYAANMHENLVPEGKQFHPHKDGAVVRGKYLERHLKADFKQIYNLYTKIYRKESGM